MRKKTVGDAEHQSKDQKAKSFKKHIKRNQNPEGKKKKGDLRNYSEK